jgi:hypothetical protein
MAVGDRSRLERLAHHRLEQQFFRFKVYVNHIGIFLMPILNQQVWILNFFFFW